MKTTNKQDQTKTTATTAAIADTGAQGTPTKPSAPKAAKPKKNAPQSSQGARKGNATAKKPAASKQSKPKKTAASAATRAGSKKQMLIDLLARDNGVTLAEIMTATGWQAHSVRGFIAGSLKRAGFTPESSKNDAGERTYRIAK